VDSDLTARLSDCPIGVHVLHFLDCACVFFHLSPTAQGTQCNPTLLSDLTLQAGPRSSLEIDFVYFYFLSDEPDQSDCTRVPDWSIASDSSDRPIVRR